MTITWPGQSTWNGPYCPTCGKPYLQQTSTTFTTHTPYAPRHRKPGPAL